jgi:hypothetical protein
MGDLLLGRSIKALQGLVWAAKASALCCGVVVDLVVEERRGRLE